MNYTYCHRLEEATHCTICTIAEDRCTVYQLVDPCGDVIAEFEEFNELQCYTIEAVERFEALQGVAL